MLHIVKNKAGKFEVKGVGKNGKLVSGSEGQAFSRKAGAYTNIRAQMAIFGGNGVRVQDDTVDKPVVWWVSKHKIEDTNVKPHKRYVQAWEKKKAHQAKLPLPKTRIRK